MGFTNPYPASRLTVDSSNSLVTGMNAWFPLTEAGGTSAQCILHPSHVGTLQGNAAFVSSEIGRALSCSGISQSGVDVPTNPAASVPYTVSVWFKTSNTSSDMYIIDGDDSSDRIAIYRNTGGTLIAYAGGSCFFGTSNSVIADGNWHHVAAVCTSSAITVYFDGVQDGTGSAATNSISGFRIGARFSYSSNWDGELQNVRTYDRALSATEVAILYHRPWEGSNYGDLWPYSPPEASSMVLSSDASASSLMNSCLGWWPLTTGSGTTAKDVVGTNDGTLTSGISWANGSLGNASEHPSSASEYISTGLDLAGKSAVTVSAWIRNDGSNSGASYGKIVTQSHGGNFDSYISKASNTDLKFHINATTLGANQSDIPTRGDWFHVCFLWEQSLRQEIYINGKLSNSTTANSSVIGSTTHNVFIGGTSAATRPWDGGIQNVRIWDRALSSSEVALLAERPWEGIEYGDTFHYDPPAPASMLPLTSDAINTDLEAWWAGTDNTGTTLVDISGNSLDATLTGTNDWQNTELGVANLFDNSSSRNSHAETANTQPDLTSAFTWSAWQKIDSAENISSGNRWGCSFVLGDSSGSSDVEIYFNSSSADPNQFPNVVFNRSNGGTVVSSNHAKPSNGVVFDEWAHYVIVYDGSDTKSYRNGVLANTVSISGSPLSTSGKKIFVNEFPAYSSLSGLTAHMQNMRLWSRALSADEVWSIYANPWLGSNYKLASGSTPLYNYIFRTERFRRLG